MVKGTLCVSFALIMICSLALAGYGQGEAAQAEREAAAQAGGASKLASRTIRLPTVAAQVTVISALPAAERGAEMRGEPEFPASAASAENGFVELELGEEPLWIVERELPEVPNPKPELSPFGFHPAKAHGAGYDYAREIGVVWDRTGLYFMWVLVQPDLAERKYIWRQYDRYFDELPPGILPLKNITVAHDGMVKVPGRPPHPRVKKGPPVDVSQYLDGTTYRPKDPEAYAAWVKAAVERYDGDGKDDMPGLRTPVKHWQIDNEPPRGRKGYSDLVRITGKAIREADPEAKVLIGGLVMPYGERTRRYEKFSLPILKELAGEGIDIVDLHWFGHVGEWRELPQALARVRKDLEECGFKNTPIWIVEMGTYSGTPVGRGPVQHPTQTERTQASEMIKRYAVALGEGVGKLFWAWGMMEGFIDPRDNDFFDNTGFVYDGLGPGDPGKGTRKIVYWSYRKMTDLLQYWDGSRPERIDAGEGVFAYRFNFAGDSDRGVIACWRAD